MELLPHRSFIVQQLSLLPSAFAETEFPRGLVDVPQFISEEEERILLAHIEALSFAEVKMHGVAARRTVVHHGFEYGYGSWSLRRTGEIPPYLLALRDRAAALAGVAPGELAEALTSRYPPGAGIGWHRDAPMFGVVVGISLLAPCTMRFRRAGGDKGKPLELRLAPRSAYVLDGEARSAFQHGIPPVRALRYSISFRTVRDGAVR
jgi:alkylated DNA repair dioxygenase AlkB